MGGRGSGRTAMTFVSSEICAFLFLGRGIGLDRGYM